MAGLGRVKMAEVPAWAYEGCAPSAYTFFAAIALACLEDVAIRLDAATQRALLGFPVFGKRVFRVDARTGTVRVMRSACFGTDCNSGDYPASIVRLAAEQKKGLNPGCWQDVHVPASLVQ